MEENMTDEELIRAIRLDIAAELEATNQYLKHAAHTSNQKARKVFFSVAGEEKVHTGEFLALLDELSPEDAKLIRQGRKEACEKIKCEEVERYG